MPKYFTQIREQADGSFAVMAGDDPDQMTLVGTRQTFEAAQGYRTWWVRSMGMESHHIDHGFRPLVPMQGHIPGH